MSSTMRSPENSSTAAKQAALFWLSGFAQACSLHRVLIFCYSSKPLLIRTGQCFLLNGLIFLGSLLTLRSFVIPTLLWILPEQCEQCSDYLHDHQAVVLLYSYLRFILIQLFYIFWFYPLYIFSIILSTLWYNDIAKHAFDVVKKRDQSKTVSSGENSQTPPQLGLPGGIDGVCLGIGEQVYSFILLGVFFIEVYATGFIPYLGKAINFLLLSWMYAYYCFEYKWNYSQVSLNKRLDFFETNWAFFLGFGSPCVFAIFFFSPLVSYGVMAILYPLFVLTAAGTKEEQIAASHRLARDGETYKLPIFYGANIISMRIVKLLPDASKQK